ncbi:MAG: TetR/AcrR family transcriptional regulator [Parasphingorhabdus sp.]
MTKPPYHHGDLKTAILDAAEKALADKSLGSISIRELARQAGVSSGAPYHHFGDREGLVTALCQRGFHRLEKRLEDARSDDGLVGMVKEYLSFAKDHAALYQLMFSPEVTAGDSKAKLHPFAAPVFEMLERQVGDESDNGSPQSPHFSAISVWCFMHGVASLSSGPTLEGRLGDQKLETFAYEAVKMLTNSKD